MALSISIMRRHWRSWCTARCVPAMPPGWTSPGAAPTRPPCCSWRRASCAIPPAPRRASLVFGSRPAAAATARRNSNPNARLLLTPPCSACGSCCARETSYVALPQAFEALKSYALRRAAARDSLQQAVRLLTHATVAKVISAPPPQRRHQSSVLLAKCRACYC